MSLKVKSQKRFLLNTLGGDLTYWVKIAYFIPVAPSIFYELSFFDLKEIFYTSAV